MNNNIFYFFLHFFLYLCTQNTVNVIITGLCSEVSCTYTYIGLVNVKNNYTKRFVIEGVSVVIGFDNMKWVLYGGDSIVGFSNTVFPKGLLHLLTGWTNTGCELGTKIIKQNLSSDDSVDS
jgi:hypothetical protein